MTNEYSASWRREFGVPDPARTEAEIAFLRRVLPLPAFRRILDVPCGSGRHHDVLIDVGYEVVGADNDPAVSPDVLVDLRELDGLPDDFDAVVNMWASFGYFDADENECVLASFARRVRPGGRVVIDVQNRGFFEGRDGERELRPGIIERSRLAGGRRLCELRYAGGTVDVFDWQLYTPEELAELAAAHGLAAVEIEATNTQPTMQLVFERRQERAIR